MVIPPCIQAQILPKDGATLNYRIVGFSFQPGTGKTNNYSLQIASGNYYSEDSFNKHIILSQHSNKSEIIAEVPAFGSQYTWRTVFFSGKSEIKSELHHFNTGVIPEVDNCIVRFRITKPASKYKDAYVFLDGNRILYDMSGNPVWYLPLIDGQRLSPSDLQLSPKGTITFLANNQAYEINYQGDILWKAPNKGTVSGDSVEHYHHEFTRLSNGHYMVLGTNDVLCKYPIPLSIESKLPITDDDKINKGSGDTSSKQLPFGNLIEYDEKGNVVWVWKSSDYFSSPDHCYYIPSQSNLSSYMRGIDVHANAFFFDEKDQTIYISFKNISRVTKIKYPEGTILNNYGEIYNKGAVAKSTVLFCGQHCVRRAQNAEIGRAHV